MRNVNNNYSIIYRLKIGLPKDNYRTIAARIKWFLFGVSISVYEFGSCNGSIARKDKRDGSVSFKLWKAGEQGHDVDFWHNFDSSWWDEFKVHCR
jgi:hypothetical protein